MPLIPTEYVHFWTAAEKAKPHLDRARFLEAFAFGDSEHMAQELAELVLQGTKRATASLVWSYDDGRPQPKPGDLSIVTTWSKEPLCIIETTAVDVAPFEEVSEDFASAEGEGDASLQSWRHNHTAFFAGECARLGRTQSPRMLVVCERFKVVYQPRSATSAA